MSAAVAIFPSLKRAAFSFREVCTFDMEGYHQQRLAAPGECLVFVPKDPGFYRDWRGRFDLQENVRAELRRPGTNVVPFKPPRPQLRLCLEGGDWVVWAFLPAGERLPLSPAYPCRDYGEEALWATREMLRRETGVQFEVGR